MSDIPGKIWGVVRRYKVVIGGMIIVLMLLGGLIAYSGIWPPIFVVESASMQHSDTESDFGIIDTGDLVVVQATGGDHVRTYVECYPDGHRSFGDFGDVIIYERYGRSEYTPIIHRAMLRLEFNNTALSFDIPSLALLPAEKWSNGPVENGRWWNLSSYVEIYDIGYRSALLRLDLADLLSYYDAQGLDHGGIITMGDHNVVKMNGDCVGIYDQSTTTICREPIMDGWIVGEANLEIPWLGLIKLWVNGNMPSNTPENSKTGLMVTLAVLIVVPLAIDLTGVVLKKKGIDPWARIKELMRRKKE